MINTPEGLMEAASQRQHPICGLHEFGRFPPSTDNMSKLYPMGEGPAANNIGGPVFAKMMDMIPDIPAPAPSFNRAALDLNKGPEFPIPTGPT